MAQDSFVTTGNDFSGDRITRSSRISRLVSRYERALNLLELPMCCVMPLERCDFDSSLEERLWRDWRCPLQQLVGGNISVSARKLGRTLLI